MKYPRYLFDVDFDALPKKPAKPSEAELRALAAPTFTEDELKRECSKAREAGIQEGLAQSNAGFEHRIAETLAEIDVKFAALDAAQRKTNERIAQSAVSLAAAIATKVASEYARENGMAEIEAFVAQCLSNLFGDVEIAIRVPEAMAEALAERLPPLAKRRGLENGIRIIADPDLAPADCRIDWTDGGAERNGENLLASIDAIVDKFLEHTGEQDINVSDEPEPAGTAADDPESAADAEPGANETPAEAATAAISPAPPSATPTVSMVSDAAVSEPASLKQTTPEQGANPPDKTISPGALPTPPDDATPENPLPEETSEVPVLKPTKAADNDAPPALPGAVGTESSTASAGTPILPGAIAPDSQTRK